MSDSDIPDILDANGHPDASGQPGSPRRTPLSARAAAEELGVHERTVRRWIDQGQLTALKVRGSYRIDPEEIERARMVMLGEGLEQVIEATSRASADMTDSAGNDRAPEHDRAAAAAAPGSITVSAAARAQLEAIRDEWVRPFVADIERLSRENGQLRAEREAMQLERDDLNARLQAAQDAAMEQRAEQVATDLLMLEQKTSRPWWRRLWEL